SYGWVKFVSSVHHAVEQPPVLIRKPVVYVEEPDLPVVGEPGNALVDLVNDGDELKVVVPRKDGGQDDSCVRRFGPADAQDSLDPPGDILHGLVSTRQCGHVVGAGEYHNDLWVYPVEFAVLQPPEDIRDPVCA